MPYLRFPLRLPSLRLAEEGRVDIRQTNRQTDGKVDSQTFFPSKGKEHDISTFSPQAPLPQSSRRRGRQAGRQVGKQASFLSKGVKWGDYKALLSRVIST